MRSWMVGVMVLVAVGMVGAPAQAFGGLAETMGATGVQGALAGSGTRGVASTIGGARSNVTSAASRHNQALDRAVGPGAARRGGPATWMTAGTGPVRASGDGWATLTGGRGGHDGWKSAQAFAGGGQDAWATAQSSWAPGGILPR